MTMTLKVAVHGCDDSTYIHIEATAEQEAFLEMVAAKIGEASTYGCMPTMDIERVAAMIEAKLEEKP